jgi:protein-S-isoprenylcysteine O-methyltransferase Ste14
MTPPFSQIVAVCWFVFLVFWNISAWGRRASKRTASLTFTISNTGLLYAGFVLVLMTYIRIAPTDVRFTSGSTWAEVLGTALVALGIALAIWSRWVLGVQWSATVRIVSAQRVVRDGPYACMAHPIYSGIALAAFGTALVGGTLVNLLGFVLITISFWQKARLEERFLLAEFGEEYAAYRRGVNFMIPYIW